MASFWGSETNRVRDEVPTHIEEDLSRRYRKFSEPQLRSWLALDTPSKCLYRSYTIENSDSSVSNQVRSEATSLNDGWEGPKIIENFKTPVTLVKGVCGWMASFWGSETNRVRDEVPTHIGRGPLTQVSKIFRTPVTLVVGLGHAIKVSE
ncbi:hypothetical protein U1Q18_050441 [Sarracenia purpurea var. burkii]